MAEWFLLSNKLWIELKAVLQCKCTKFAYRPKQWLQLHNILLTIFVYKIYLTDLFNY